MNGKAKFASDILKQYAEETGNIVRGTTDISPLEEWLIIKLFETKPVAVEKIRPDHYKLNDGKELWQLMIEEFGLQAFINFCQLSIVKYRHRAGLKPGETQYDDEKKAKWYEEKINQLSQ